MFIACFDIKNPKGSEVVDCKTLEEGYADLSKLYKKKCPAFDVIIVGKEFDLEGKTYCFFEDDELANMWLSDHRYAPK